MVDILGLPLDARLLLAAAATTLAGFIRGFTGFGAALVVIPILSLAYDPRLAVVAMTVMGIPTLFQLLPEAIRTSERAIVVPAGLAIMAAAPLGTWLLVLVPAGIMKVAIAVLVLAMVGLLAGGWRLTREVRLPVLVGSGLAAGVVQGAAGVGGPPVVAVALSRPGSAEQQRGNVLALMTAVSASAVPPQLWFGLFSGPAIALGLILLPVYGFSIMLGSRYFATGGQQHYRRAALSVLAAIGLATLIAALRDAVGF